MTNAPLSGANLRGAVDLSSLVRPPAPPAGAVAAATQGGAIRAASDASFTQVLDLSSVVPVVVEFYGQGIEPALAPIVRTYGGRLALATVDATANPQLVQAFQVQQVPTVAAVVAGRPIQLFAGVLTEPELRDVFEQLLQVAAQQNVTGSVEVGEEPSGEPAAPVEEPLPPHHQEAYDAISVGDFATAIKEYETAIAQNPRDQLAVAGLAQVSLLLRLESIDGDAVRSAPADDLESQLSAADLNVAAGALDEAFAGLLGIFTSLEGPNKNRVRARLLEYFEIVGSDDPRVIAARRQLTNLLY
jgi:putative thioredoxin